VQEIDDLKHKDVVRNLGTALKVTSGILKAVQEIVGFLPRHCRHPRRDQRRRHQVGKHPQQRAARRRHWQEPGKELERHGRSLPQGTAASGRQHTRRRRGALWPQHDKRSYIKFLIAPTRTALSRPPPSAARRSCATAAHLARRARARSSAPTTAPSSSSGTTAPSARQTTLVVAARSPTRSGKRLVLANNFVLNHRFFSPSEYLKTHSF